ncbi:MAG: hypothetical protein IPO19_00425 [Rhodoferax sp.]|nr:hypothetical protein [Rhodoferax sp.]
MKQVTVLAMSVAAAMLSSAAMAQLACPANTTRVQTLTAVVGGKTMCAASGGDRWQEWHNGSNAGPLVDYKRGPGHAVDPTETVGTFIAIDGASSRLTHIYSGGGTYSWIVCADATNTFYTLVSTGGAPTITGVTLLPGLIACP